MSKVKVNAKAPDFVLPRFDGEVVRLADYAGNQHVVLVFNRGFA
jgi:peroxiredoxin